MGRRSRKREPVAGTAAAPGREERPEPPERAERSGPAGRTERAAAPRPRDPRRRPSLDERPKAPWHPIPLVELCVLVGLIMCVLGFFALDEDRGPILLIGGLVLASLGGLETAVREHFTGFRSHSTVLAGLPSVALAGLLFVLGAPAIAILAGVAIVFVLAFTFMRSRFERKTGVGWR